MSKLKRVYHRNDLRKSVSELSLPARRILWLILAQFDKDESGRVLFEKDRIFTITGKMYSELCQVGESLAYRQLKDGVREIRSKLIEIDESELQSKFQFNESNSYKNGVFIFNVANLGYYTDGGGFIRVRLDPVMEPFVSGLDRNFTSLFLLSALRIPDGNASKLYLLLREWIGAGLSQYKDIDVDSLKDSLCVSSIKTYSLFGDFKKLFFSRSVKTIISDTEFTKIEMEIIERKSRKAHKVRISYEYEDYGQSNRPSGHKVSYPDCTGPSKRALEMREEIENLKQ
jgi:plasmid replication initiation protein